MMLGRKAALLVLVAMAALIAAPTMTSLPTGIDSQGDSGCTCHGDSSTATTIVVDGLPENFTAGQSYDFTLTVVNDGMTLWQDGDAEAGWNGRSGGFRVIVSEGTVTGDSTLTQEMKGGL
ncbi:MAG TPA: hypothetical protein EYN88_04865, partial [Candidatus Poseidoniales archaeon]|nr:hypothetical protein [Candidatus Poseidoniales archaeon]